MEGEQTKNSKFEKKFKIFGELNTFIETKGFMEKIREQEEQHLKEIMENEQLLQKQYEMQMIN